jgi:hypothetical protein
MRKYAQSTVPEQGRSILQEMLVKWTAISSILSKMGSLFQLQLANPSDPEIHLNIVLTENTLHFHYTDHRFNALYEKCYCLLRESYETHKYIVIKVHKYFSVKVGGRYSYRCFKWLMSHNTREPFMSFPSVRRLWLPLFLCPTPAIVRNPLCRIASIVMFLLSRSRWVPRTRYRFPQQRFFFTYSKEQNPSWEADNPSST